MANLDFYGMFDYTSGDSDIYEYTSTEFAELIAGITGNGVSANTREGFAATANGLTITVGSGECFIKGRYGYNESNTVITLSAVSASAQRIDRIVVELNIPNRVMELKVIQGTSATSAVAPSLTQTNIVYQLPLYRVLITNGSTTALTDERILTYSASEVLSALTSLQTEIAGKASATHTHTPASLGAAPSNHTHTLEALGAAASSHTHTLTALGAAATSHTHSLSGSTIIDTLPIEKGGTGATNAATALINLGIVYSATTPTVVNGGIWLKPVS